jgi:membrane-anchored glycerophosphoryl diester phosphodiesterase (GDPDase)
MGGVAIAILLIVLGIRLTLAVPALVLERQRPLDALRRSWNLVRGSTWRTFGILFLATLVVGVISGLVSVMFLPGVMEGILTGSLTSLLLVTLGSGVVQVLLGPIVPILLTVLYFDYARRATA